MGQIDIETRVHRILRPIVRFNGVKTTDDLPVPLRDDLRAGERLLGVYSNPGEEVAVAVTSEGVRVVRGSQQSAFVPYEEIRDARAAFGSKRVGGVHVELTSGATEYLPILGGTGRQLDSLEFVRFLMRVVEDRRRKE